MSTINVAHSPDSDDFFLFWAILNERIDCEGLSFSFVAHDTHKLNQLAQTDNYDVIAISLATYPKVANKYLILPHGACFGRNYGPIVVAKKNYTIEELNTLTIGTPGKSTTAHNILKLVAPKAETKEIPIDPYSQIFEALAKDEINAALLIHEGQLTYKEHNLKLILDLGTWWNENMNLPLPLGVNLINKALPEELITKISRVIKRSISYGMSHQKEIVSALKDLAEERKIKDFNETRLNEYLGMYANTDSLELTEELKEAISKLLYVMSPNFLANYSD